MSITESQLLEVLNSAPVHDGAVVETLTDPRMIAVRDDLQSVIRGASDPAQLGKYLRGVSQTPTLGADGVEWTLAGPASALPYAEVVLEWSRVQQELPGRLRACADPECNKFLIDHSKPNSARWCSMAVCGNRAKARAHYARQATAAAAN